MASPALLDALQDRALYDHEVTRFALLETHISWVLLTGPYAYKIKKPVDLGFLDFSTLERRHHFCTEELRLNRRLAPRLYRDIVTITGSEASPRLDGQGPVVDYALRMVEFPQEALLDRVLRSGELTNAHIDAMATAVAAFHADATVADGTSPYGEPDLVFRPMRENFSQIDPLLESPAGRARLERLRDWTLNRYQALHETLLQRKADGFIRECHGDLHLGNLVLDGDTVTAFDCLEFDPALRWTDVQSDLAFLLMDLVEHGSDGYAHRLLDAYLAASGDYGGLRVLPFYQVYRALVRAKVAAIRLGQSGTGSDELRDYLALAERLQRPRQPFLVITHGLSGSGKSYISQHLLERLGAVRLRSDIERKRLLGRSAASLTPESAKGAVYGSESSARTYARLVALARTLLDSGTPAIVDATFLRRDQRAPFVALADELRLPFAILDVQAPHDLLAERVEKRTAVGRDPSEADGDVVALQRATAEPLDDDERRQAIAVDGARPDLDRLAEQLTDIGNGREIVR